MKTTRTFIARSLLFLCLSMLMCGGPVYAENQPASDLAAASSEFPKKAGHHLTPDQRKMLAREFVMRMKGSLKKADDFLAQSKGTEKPENLLGEGESVLMQPVLDPNDRTEGMISGMVRNGKIVFSMKDVASVLEFPIVFDEKAQTASGWYIRKEKPFSLNMPQKTVVTDQGHFPLSPDVVSENGDIFASADDMAKWFGFEMKADIAEQEIKIKSPLPLAFQERYARRKLTFTQSEVPEPTLPRAGEAYKAAGIPMVDVATNSAYNKSGTARKPSFYSEANIRTSSDLAHGNLVTQSLLDNQDQLRSVHATYKRESEKPELLGGLKARKYEIGDVTTANVPLASNTTQELGFHATNIDPLRGTVRPSTAISGTAFPGWDVELYRDNQVIGFQQVGDNGTYQFNQVNLFEADNRFRVVLYGPQGEVEERNVYVPVNTARLSDTGGIYDVSMTLDDKQTYLKKSLKDNNAHEVLQPNIAAYYEHSLGLGTTLSGGLVTQENQDQRDYLANAGISQLAFETLFNANAAVDNEGDVKTELTARRSFGDNDVSDRLSWAGANFDAQDGTASNVSVLQNELNMQGPLPIPLGTNPRYIIGNNYSETSNGDTSLTSRAGINTSLFRRIAFSQELNYQTDSTQSQDRTNAVTNIAGSYGRNRMRIGTDYNINPDSELMRVLASYNRSFSNNMDFEMQAERRPQQSITEYSARLDWQAGFIRISPSITYNTEKDFFAGLNTRFGLLRDPHTNSVKFFDRDITSNGSISTFVFLDKNGNSKFDEGEEPLPEVTVESPQNGGKKQTDKNGIAFFESLQEMRATDIFLDPETLQDPTWVPGFKGVSILPRSGYIASVDFPVHIAGEMDGTLYLNGSESQVLRNIPLTLYNDKGDAEMTATTDPGGFYYFTRIPPGRYLLVIDEGSAQRGNFIRPEPQEIEIGYDGTVIYGHDIKVDAGPGDVPSEIMANLEDYKARHPQIDFSKDNFDLVLNLGDYNSNVLMSLIWYKLRTRYAPIVADSKIFVPPSESYADVKTGKHTLRVGLNNETIDGAYKRCRALMARSQYCKVEIYPAYMKQAKADVPPQELVAQ